MCVIFVLIITEHGMAQGRDGGCTELQARSFGSEGQWFAQLDVRYTPSVLCSILAQSHLGSLRRSLFRRAPARGWRCWGVTSAPCAVPEASVRVASTSALVKWV